MSVEHSNCVQVAGRWNWRVTAYTYNCRENL